MAVAVDI